MTDRWEFWIDVGGTFTDCLARDPGGHLHSHKLLSTGVYRGGIDTGSNRSSIRSKNRQGDPLQFFNGFRFDLLSSEGISQATRTVAHFEPETGTLHLDAPLPFDPDIGAVYELSSLEEAPVVGIRWLMGKKRDESVGPCAIRLGTTRGTNALLERLGAQTALVVTSGFRDVLRIAYQDRPKLFDLEIHQPDQLYAAVIEIEERLDANGKILRPLNELQARQQFALLKEKGIASLAIVLLHSYRNSAHEDRLATLAAETGFQHVSVSSSLSPSQRIVPRGDTTLVDAYLTPLLREYVAQIQTALPEADLCLMTSSGALTHAKTFRAKDLILSGPAGGVVGVIHVSKAAGFSSAIGFDMGGTSTDVCQFSGSPERRYMMEIKDTQSQHSVRVVAPMLTIETVAAGGGSICGFDGQKVFVGPRVRELIPGRLVMVGEALSQSPTVTSYSVESMKRLSRSHSIEKRFLADSMTW